MWKTLEMARTLSESLTESESVSTDNAPDEVIRMEIPLGVLIIATYIVLGHCVDCSEPRLEEGKQDKGLDVYMNETENIAPGGWWYRLVSSFH